MEITRTYLASVKRNIHKDYLKVWAMGINPYRLINSVYDVLAGKKPLYMGMDFDSGVDYFVEFSCEGIDDRLS